MLTVFWMALAGLVVLFVMRRDNKPIKSGTDLWNSNQKAANVRAETGAWKPGRRWVFSRELARAVAARAVAEARDSPEVDMRVTAPKEKRSGLERE